MNPLKSAATKLIESFAFDDEMAASPETPLPEPTKVRYNAGTTRGQQIAQLAQELGRQPTEEEIDLILSPEVAEPESVLQPGTYGRQDTDPVDDLAGMADELTGGIPSRRGPTSRRFNAPFGESIVMEAMERPVIRESATPEAFARLGYALAPLMVTPASDYYVDMVGDGEFDSVTEGMRGAINVFVDMFIDQIDPDAVGFPDSPENTRHVLSGADKWCVENRDLLRDFDTKVQAFHAQQGVPAADNLARPSVEPDAR